MNEVILLGRIANKLPKVEELDDKPLFLSLAVDKIVAGRKTTRFIPITKNKVMRYLLKVS